MRFIAGYRMIALSKRQLVRFQAGSWRDVIRSSQDVARAFISLLANVFFDPMPIRLFWKHFSLVEIIARSLFNRIYNYNIT